MRVPDSLYRRLGGRPDDRRRRLAGVVLALLAEGFLALLLLTLGRGEGGGGPREKGLPVTFTLAPPASPAPPADASEPESAPASPARAAPAPTPDAPAPPVPPPPVPDTPSPAPAFIPVAPAQMAALDTPRSRPLPKGTAGPPDTGSPYKDTPRVEGSGPNGEPLYAAAWYREPYPEELRGYLSTANGPGWALIACRTVRDWRVEDCVGQDEFPTNSGILRAVLAAAWQFKVRPPMLGGRYKVGEWVRIRIDYTRG